MAEVRKVRARDNGDLVDPTSIGQARRPGDRAVTWLVIAFVFLAVVVLGFAIARSRTARSRQADLSVAKPATRPDEGFRVVRILDGDTLVIVGQDDIELTLRLTGIDAPEKDQPFGDGAAQYLEGLVSEQIVHLDNVKREKFGRVLADVYVGPRWVDLEIVQQGWAWVYPGSDSRVLREAEDAARALKVGLWSSESPTAPWEWRKNGQ